MPRPRVLTVAGSDPSGGAGVQADCVTLAAWGCHAVSAVTALTVQDSRGVHEVAPVATSLIAQQIRASLGDGPIAAAKTGMLPTADAVAAVAESLAGTGVALVVDPVARSGTGVALGDSGAREALLRGLLPLARVLTPNAEEAAELAGFPVVGADDAVEAARALVGRGASAVLVKGGHLQGDAAIDVLVDGERGEPRFFRRPRVAHARRVHGAGCALSAALAAALARKFALEEAVAAAGDWVHAAIAAAHGSGPGALLLDLRAPAPGPTP